MVRDYRPEDRGELKQIHGQLGIDYQFPNLDHPLFFVRKVLETNGTVQGALVLKVCAETYLLLGEGKPQDRFLAMKLLQDSVLAEAYLKGLDEIHAAIPDIGLNKRYAQLGWVKDRPGWNLWTRSTLAIGTEPGQ